MALSDHLRELRARLIRSALFLVIAFCVALFFYDQLLDAGASTPTTRPRIAARTRGPRPTAYVAGATGAAAAAAEAVRGGARSWLEPVLALPDLGVHRARACTPTRRSGRGSSRRVAGPLFLVGVATRLLRAAQGPRGADRLHARAALQNLVEFGEYFSLPHPDAAGLRHRVRDPAVRDHAQPRRRGLRQAAGALPARGSSSAPSSSPRSRRRRPTRSRC